MAVVHTVRGAVAAAGLGATLAHEHVVVSNTEFARFYPELAWPEGRETAVAAAAARLQQVKERGIDAIVDCTAFLHGRDVDFVQEVNRRVDIHVVMSTGIYTHDHLPHFLALRPGGPGDLLTAMFLRDLREGIADSGVRANMIKVAVDAAGITPNVHRVLAAGAEAAVESGAPITAHTHAPTRNGIEVQRCLVRAGVAPERIVIGHAGDSPDLAYLQQLMDRGSVVASDRFGLQLPGTPGEEERIAAIARLSETGYADRIVLGHDSMLAHDWGPRIGASPEHATWTPTRVPDVVLPALRARGVSEAALEQMMTTNLARVLART